MLSLNKTFCLVASLGVVAAVAQPSWAESMPAKDPCFAAQTGQYKLAGGDILRVSVWQEAELSRELKLRPDGGFYFPLAGEIQAQGQTLSQLRQILKQKIAKFVAEPEVSVSLVTTAKTVYIIGKVNRSTDIPLDKPLTITQALAKAGGMTAFADSNDIQLVRKCNGLRASFEFNYDQISQGKALSQDISLRDGDLIIVP